MPGSTGIAHIRTSGSTGAGETFVSLYRFLTTSGSTIAGVQLVANSTGSGGVGFDYPDQANRIGNNAWAVFKFLSSSIPFYMLLQVATGTNNTPFGNSPGNPGAISNWGTNYSAYGGLGIQFALRGDGGDAWNGTKLANGTDTKGSVVWTSGTSDLYVWPRCNSISGNFASSRQKCYMLQAHSYTGGPQSTAGYRLHMAIDFDNVAFAGDRHDAVGTYNFTWFGKYQPYSGSSVSDATLTPRVPYAMLSRNDESANPIIGVTSAPSTNTYGSVSGDADLEGGIANPLVSGSVVSGGAMTLSVYPFSIQFHPNSGYASTTFDEYPIVITCNEQFGDPNRNMTYSMVGETDYLRFVYGLFTGDASTGNSRVVFGGAPTTRASSKYSFPWSNNVDSILSGTTTSSSRTGSYY